MLAGISAMRCQDHGDSRQPGLEFAGCYTFVNCPHPFLLYFKDAGIFSLHSKSRFRVLGKFPIFESAEKA